MLRLLWYKGSCVLEHPADLLDLTLHKARMLALSEVDSERSEQYMLLKYTVTISKTVGLNQAQTRDKATGFSVGGILASYGAPLFLCYLLVPPPAAPRLTVNAFDVLMQEPQLEWPVKMNRGINAKFDLKSDFQTWLEERKVGWLAKHVEAHGAPFINTMTDALWYVDRQHVKLHARACSVPLMLQNFSGYNQPEKHGHKWPTFSAKIIKCRGSKVRRLAFQLWLQKPAYADLRIALEQFGDALTKYGAFFDRELAIMKKNRVQTGPVRRVEDSQEIVIHRPLGVVEPQHAETYGKLVHALTTANFYQPVFVGNYGKVAIVTQRTY